MSFTKINPIVKTILIALLIILLILFLCESWRRYVGGFAGSFPFAESWTLPYPEEDVIRAIEILKNKNPELRPPAYSETLFVRKKQMDYWLFVDFYYADTKQIVHTWTRPRSRYKQDGTFTTLALVSLEETELSVGKRIKLLNRDFNYFQNKRQVNKFKYEILSELTNILESERD